MKKIPVELEIERKDPPKTSFRKIEFDHLPVPIETSVIDKEEPEVDPKEFSDARKLVFSMLGNHKLFVTGAAAAAASNGAVWPIYGILLADAIGVLSEKLPADVAQGGLNVSMMFMALAIGAAFVLWMQK